MKNDIFSSPNYKQYLKSWMEKLPKKGRGAKSRLARATGCQPAYISQVLNGHLHLSLEQAEAVNAVVGHGQEEAHYFLMMVQKERAGTRSLKKYFQDQMESALKRRFVLKDRLGVLEHLNLEEQQVYYSSWVYAAVHVIADIPQFNTKEAMARRLGLPLQRVADILDFLLKTGLVVSEGTGFKMGTKSIHLGSDSALISKHHTNWRMRAIASLDNQEDESIHYSSAIALSEADVTKVKTLLVEAIAEVKKTVRESKQEGLYCFSMDFFKI